MIESIAFFVASPFSRRDYERFGIEILKENGFIIRVIDCTSIVNYNFHEKYNKKLSYSFDGNEIVKSFEEACKIIQKLESETTIIVDLLGNNELAIKLRSKIKYTKILSMQLFLGLIPELPALSWSIKRIILKMKNPLSLLKQVVLKVNNAIINNKTNGIDLSPDFIVGSGENSLRNIDANKTKVIWAHAMDYDLYLNNKTMNVSESHIVFLDEDMLFHSDYDYMNISSPVTVENYFSSLNKFFEKLEQYTGKKVVIAEHPRSNYEKKPDYFNGRKRIKGQTAELIRDASLVLFHASTSINLAILWGKPALGLTTNELENSWFQPRIKCLVNAIGAKLINLDDIKLSENIVSAWMNVNDVRYKEYKRKYIKKDGTPDVPIWQIVSVYLNTFHQLYKVENV